MKKYLKVPSPLTTATLEKEFGSAAVSFYRDRILSKVCNENRYGVRLLARARELACAAIGVPGRPDRRRLPCRVYCRLSRTQYARLQTAQRAQGYATMQDALADIIDAWLLAHGGAQEEARA